LPIIYYFSGLFQSVFTKPIGRRETQFSPVTIASTNTYISLGNKNMTKNTSKSARWGANRGSIINNMFWKRVAAIIINFLLLVFSAVMLTVTAMKRGEKSGGFGLYYR
jgi:hypothetical protein